jgi:superfamily II RNA helicase
MVVICEKQYPSNSKYQSSFELYPHTLSDFQKYAIQAIIEENHVLITAHTGSGKTLPAEFAIQHLVGQGKKVIYTSPIKALSNQKYYEFTQKYPSISFGLFTGDIKTNPEADVLIMTTEILMNYLFIQGTSKSNDELPIKTLDFQIDIHRDLGCVIFDEVHYINDTDRGHVWEKTILMLPKHIQMVMLSATIDNPVGFAKWCERNDSVETPNNKEVYLATTSHRVVPLTHYGFLTTTESIFKKVKDKVVQKEIRDNTNTLITIQNEHGKFNETGYKTITKINKLFEINRVELNQKHVLNQLCTFLRERGMLPAISFVFSRKQVELYASNITVPLLEFDSKVAYTIRYECEQIVRKLSNYHEYLELPEYIQLVALLEKGIGIHHSGMIPVLREIVELMISKKYIKILFATESFAIGLDCPIKTAIFTKLSKFDGHYDRNLMPHEYTQMAGRAGRRGIDTIGNVIHCNNLFSIESMTEYKQILGGIPQKLISKYHISYSVILNLIKNGQTSDFHKFSEKSMVYNEMNSMIQGLNIEKEKLIDEILKKNKFVINAQTPKHICDEYIIIEQLIINSVNKRRKKAEKDKQILINNYKFIMDDVKRVILLNDMETQLKEINDKVNNTTNFIKYQTDKICDILIKDNIIVQTTSGNSPEYELTNIGKFASSIAEVHPVIITKLVNNEWNNFEEFSSKQLIGLFSCFTNIRVPDDYKSNVPTSNDEFVTSRIKDMTNMFIEYSNKEYEYELYTGIDYETVLQYDIIDFSMKWCDCTNEIECKQFIQNDVNEMSISIGDFTKAMLKIVTIANEFIKIYENTEHINSLHKLKMIEGMILKYIMTAQSLYV